MGGFGRPSSGGGGGGGPRGRHCNDFFPHHIYCAQSKVFHWAALTNLFDSLRSEIKCFLPQRVLVSRHLIK